MKIKIPRKENLTERWKDTFLLWPRAVEGADGEDYIMWMMTVQRKEMIGYGGVQYRYREKI